MPIISNLSQKQIDLSGRLYAIFSFSNYVASRIKKPASVSQDIKKDFYCVPIPNNSLSETTPSVYILPVRLDTKTQKFSYDSDDDTALNDLTSSFTSEEASHDMRVSVMNILIMNSLRGTSLREHQVICILEDEKNFHKFMTHSTVTFRFNHDEYLIQGMKTHSYLPMINATFLIYSALKNVVPCKQESDFDIAKIRTNLRSILPQLPKFISDNFSLDLYFDDSWLYQTVKHFSFNKTIDKQTFFAICEKGTKAYNKYLTQSYLEKTQFPMLPSKLISNEDYAELQPGIEAMRQFILNRKTSNPHPSSKKKFFGDFDTVTNSFYVFGEKYYAEKIAENLQKQEKEKLKENEKLSANGFRTPSPPPPEEYEELIDLDVD